MMTKLAETSFEQFSSDLLATVAGGVGGNGITFQDSTSPDAPRVVALDLGKQSAFTSAPEYVGNLPGLKQKTGLDLSGVEAQIQKVVGSQILGFRQSQNDPFTVPGVDPRNPGDPL